MTKGQKKVMGYIEDGEPDAVKKERIKIKTADEEPVPQISNAEAKTAKLKDEDFIHTTTNENYEFPPIDLLKKSRANVTGETPQTLQEKAMKLEDTLRSFNIDATVTNVTQGPAVTRYEVHPHSGVRVKGIKNLADDIAHCFKYYITMKAPETGASHRFSPSRRIPAGYARPCCRRRAFGLGLRPRKRRKTS